MAVPRVASPSSPWPAHARVALATPRTFAPALGFALALACASLATQTYWLETGDDFLLGLVPAFNPAGVGNLPVFAVTAALALCGAWATVLAAALRTHGLRGAAAWAFVAAGAVLLSVQRLAVPRPRLGGDPAWLAVGYAAPPPIAARDAILAAGIGVLCLVVAWAWRSADGARGRLGLGAGAFAAGSALGALADAVHLPAPLDPRWGPVLATVVARVLELAGVALVIDATTIRLAAFAPDLRVSVDEHASTAFDVRRRPGGLEIRIGPARVGRWLFAIIVALVAASLLATWAYAWWPATNRLYRLLYVDFETNVPTWWSAMQLLAAGAIGALLAAANRRGRDGRWIDWLTLAGLLVALAADESASLHELLQKPVRALIGAETWLRYPLIVPGSLAAVIVALRFRRFIGTLGPTRRRLAVGAFVFVLGALGFETVGGWFAPEAIGPNAIYVALTTVEEALEMAGAALVVLALLRHLAREEGPVGLHLTRTRDAVRAA